MNIQEKDFVVQCEVVKFETEHGWVYQGCSKCNSLPKSLISGEPNGALFCPGCKKNPISLSQSIFLNSISHTWYFLYVD